MFLLKSLGEVTVLSSLCVGMRTHVSVCPVVCVSFFCYEYLEFSLR